MKRANPLLAACAAAALAAPAAHAAGIPIEVVVVTTFQIGPEGGHAPGEFHNWVERLPLPDTLPFPQGYRDLRYNPTTHVLGIVSGEGPTHMAASITALADDPRFDFSHAYWLLAGIAGIDPHAGPAGSAAWANYVVDGDLAYEIDAREIPSDWTTGYVPLGEATPYEQPRPKVNSINGDNLFRLNKGLADWAYAISRAKVVLPDDANLISLRAQYTSYPKTQSPPQVLRGDVLAAGTFWIGALLNTWAENWVNYWSDGKATFVMTSEEDAGYMQALTFLGHAGKVDLTRVMDLRGASDFSVPPPGETAAQLLLAEHNGTGYSAFIESLTDVYLTGSSVVRELTDHWSIYRDHVPNGFPADAPTGQGPSIAFTADDFGLCEAVNEAVERAHVEGALTHASLMVGGGAAADAVARARRLPGLRVGLHLVAVEGPAVLPPADIPHLVDAAGWFPSDQLRLGLRYTFSPSVRRQLKREVAAQFAAFAATGLKLSHADAHKHMHLHPYVGALLVGIGRRHGLARVRVPSEPPAVMRRLGEPPGIAAHAMHAWTRVLRAASPGRRDGCAGFGVRGWRGADT